MGAGGRLKPSTIRVHSFPDLIVIQRALSGWSVKLNIHLHVVHRYRMRGDLTLMPPYAFIARCLDGDNLICSTNCRRTKCADS
jgi:hypothetical protein